MKDQPRTEKGQFGQKATERRGDAIALRLPASLDAQVRAAACWQYPSKEDNAALRDWVELACKERVSGPTSPAPTSELPPTSIDLATVRAAANRVAMTIRPRDRAPILKAFDALLGELLANGD